MSDRYLVRPGDSLWKIAKTQLSNPNRWPELAQLNGLQPPYKLLIGQEIKLPDRQQIVQRGAGNKSINPPRTATGSAAVVTTPQEGADTMPGRGFFFILADEILPSGKLVRKVLRVPLTPEQFVEAKPEIFGLQGKNPNSKISLGEHALGEPNSPYTSASTKPGGAPNIDGRPVYIDKAKAQAAGVTIHSTEEIIADLDRLVKENPQLKPRVDKLKSVIGSVEGEVLLEGKAPASAIKSGSAMAVTRGLRFVQAVGVVLTVYDVSKATVKSVEQNSYKPLAAEGIRQVGGWGMALAGAKIGGAAGAAVGIETGPGAILTGAAGALIFGTAGYFGADWVADFVDKN